MKVIEISGFSAVGKSHLISVLSNNADIVMIPELNAYKESLTSNNKKSFINNQVALIENALDSIKKIDFQDDKCYLFDTGVFDILSYSYYYPKCYDQKKESFYQIKKIILKKVGNIFICNQILVLYANRETLANRKNSDNKRSRGAFDQNNTIWEHVISKLRSIDNLPAWIEIIDVDAMSFDALQKLVLKKARNKTDNSVYLQDVFCLFNHDPYLCSGKLKQNS